METFEDKISKVACGSPIDHMICFDCEGKWRSKIPVRDGERVMTCPTCRQPELERTNDSMQRELHRFYTQAPPPPQLTDFLSVLSRMRPENITTLFNHVVPGIGVQATAPLSAHWSVSHPGVRRGRAPATRPTSAFCASGKDCNTRSVLHTRSKTILKCRNCHVVSCCKNCRTCLNCAP